MKAEISISVLLTLAVSLITMGVSFLEKGEYTPGIACIVVGFGLMVTTVLLFQYGIIQKVKKQTHTRIMEQAAR